MEDKTFFVKKMKFPISLPHRQGGSFQFPMGKKKEFDVKKVRDLIQYFWIRLASFFKRLPYYGKIWLIMSRNSFLIMLSQKKILFLFLFGKILRFGFFIAFLYFLVTGADDIAGYNVQQTIFFFLTFNVIDVFAQFLFREVYRFRPLLISGDFDLVLLKPFNSLFRVLLGGADIIDLITIPPIIAAVILVGKTLGPTQVEVFYYLLLIINGLIIAAAFHIAVIAMGIITLEIDHTIMIYRDITNLGRFPIDIYKPPLKGIITYLIPVGIMITLPAKAFMGLVSVRGIFWSFVLGVFVLFLSVKFWNIALRKYTSASS